MTIAKGWLTLSLNYLKTFLQALPLLWKVAPRETLFLTTATFLQGLVPALSIWIIKLVVDTITVALAQGKALNPLVVESLAAAWIGALLLEMLLGPWTSAVRGNLGDKLTARINLLLIRKADTFADLSRFEDPAFYDELQLLQQQTSYQPLSLLQTLVDGARSLVTIVAMIGLLAPLGIWVPLVMVIATAPQIIVSLYYEATIWYTLYEKSPQARRMQYYTSVMLTDTYAKEVRLFKLGSLFISRYSSAFQSLHQSMRYLRGKQALWSSGLAILSTAGNGFAFYRIVQQAFRGQISSGNVLLFIQSLAYLQRNFEDLGRSSIEFYSNLLYMRQFFSFMNSEPPMVVQIPGKPAPKFLQSGITFENVCFCYPDSRLALKDVSFTLYPGETVAIVGENGAGKTTLVKLLARLYDPTKGRILVDGVDLKELNLDEWRSHIAGVFQDFGRYALTIKENIALGDLEALENLEQLECAVEKAGMAELIEKFPSKENTRLGKQFGGTELSGGEWQKLALARAFVRTEAQLLILDEPTAALDPRSEYKVYRRFTELAQGKTTVLITHRLASVQMADRILVMKRGRLIEEGTHQELLHQGSEYALLWNMQAEQYGF